MAGPRALESHTLFTCWVRGLALALCSAGSPSLKSLLVQSQGPRVDFVLTLLHTNTFILRDSSPYPSSQSRLCPSCVNNYSTGMERDRYRVVGFCNASLHTSDPIPAPGRRPQRWLWLWASSPRPRRAQRWSDVLLLYCPRSPPRIKSTGAVPRLTGTRLVAFSSSRLAMEGRSKAPKSFRQS